MTSPRSEHVATLRQLKLLVLVLVLSNLGLGGFSFYLLRTIDRNYTELISGTVPLLNDLQTLTAKSVDAMRETGSALFNAPPAERAAAVQHSEIALAGDRRLRAAILNRPRQPALDSSLAALKAAGENFTGTAGEVVRQFAAGEIDAANRLREEALRPAFARYLEAATKAADLLEAESLKKSHVLSAKTGSVANMMLGVASWPVVLLVGLLALTAVFVLVLMVLFRGREMSDMP